MASMNNQDLPYDVWEHIATFLSSEKKKGLLSVNRALFDIAMDERYHSVTIGPLSRADTQKALARLTDPGVASRVRQLVFEPGFICKSLVQEDFAKKLSLRGHTKATTDVKLIQSVSTRGLATVPDTYSEKNREIPMDDAVGKILLIMSLLTNLRSLTVDINLLDYWDFQKNPIPFFKPGWSTFGNNIQSLNLLVPLEALPHILPAPNNNFPNLHTLSCLIVRAGRSNVSATDVLLPFLEEHRFSLRSLTVDQTEKASLSPLLELLHLPSLAHFKLVQPYFEAGLPDYSGLQHFFKEHRSHLRRFEIVVGIHSRRVYQTYPIFTDKCFSTPLPKLEHLNIDFSPGDVYGPLLSGSLSDYVHQFTASLVSLRIGFGRSLFMTDLKTLTEGFRHARLRSLEITVFFEPGLFTILSTNIPGLDTLNLTVNMSASFRSLSRSVQLDPVPTIRAMCFSQWHLRNLNLEFPHKGNSRLLISHYLQKKESREALLEALPNVKMFCGMGREEYYNSD
ncbi:hypothetical protein BDN70DRAFT_872968 [Pholiota conissans]|uniref:F-box domain-containing protein n=1 Tax=Pholiota conissans TaxID=109636 RepID=A0A9P5Z9Q1_9AGAR|nr:hypothetical protein BDN70DRAFT_872968 [Pholiota conissans]